MMLIYFGIALVVFLFFFIFGDDKKDDGDAFVASLLIGLLWPILIFIIIPWAFISFRKEERQNEYEYTKQKLTS